MTIKHRNLWIFGSIRRIRQQISRRPWIKSRLIILYKINKWIWFYSQFLFISAIGCLGTISCPPSGKHKNISFRYRNTFSIPRIVRHNLMLIFTIFTSFDQAIFFLKSLQTFSFWRCISQNQSTGIPCFFH